ncbi:MAG: calcium/proton exchanger [Bacteroidetes bacterium]|nr:calcium/proton exchanger [Bacteroidota bacterium]
MTSKDPKSHKKKRAGVFGFLLGSWLNVLLVFVPISLSIEPLGLPRIWAFVFSALAIVPLAGLIGQATEELAHWVGPGIGGLMNATFGNATELIISILALQAGLQSVVKASLVGSIIGNILLVLGASMLVGGWGREKQTFNRTRVSASASMLFLAAVALVMPAIYDLAVFGSLRQRGPNIEELSILVAAVLLATYLAGLVFSLRTHRDLITGAPGDAGAARLSPAESALLLFAATAVVAVESDLLVSGIQEATSALGMTEFFVGVIVVAVVGNAAEHASAVMMALRNRMELAVAIAAGSSTQVALFVAPVLVFASVIMGSPMTLVFNIFEVVGLALSVIAVSLITLDGESNWFEGAQLLAVYLVLAIVFYFVPPG